MNATQPNRGSRLGVRVLSLLGIAGALATATVLAASPSSAATSSPGCLFGVRAGAGIASPECVGPPVQNPPVVILQPVSQTAVEGSSVTFTAGIDPESNTTQQWLYSYDGGNSWNALTGDTGASLTLTAELSESGDELEAVFVNSAGVAYTNPATLTVTPAIATTTTLTSSADPETTYNGVEYTATVPGAPDGGLVQFLDGGAPIAGCTAAPLTSQVATCDSDYFAPGVHTITAAYQGDAGYLPSVSNVVSETINQLPAFGDVVQPLAGVGEPFLYQYAATGSPLPTVSLASGTIPPGLTLGSDGTMSGTPTTAGTYSFTLLAFNGIGPGSAMPLSIKVRAKPTVSVANSSLTEGNSGTHPMTFTVTLSRATTVAVSVKWRTANGTAIAGSDYKKASGTLTIPAGATKATFTVLVIGDRIVEPNETFSVTLSSPTGAKLGTATATGTIVNDD